MKLLHCIITKYFDILDKNLRDLENLHKNWWAKATHWACIGAKQGRAAVETIGGRSGKMGLASELAWEGFSS